MLKENIMSDETHDRLCQEYFDKIDEQILDHEGMDNIIQPPTESELKCLRCESIDCHICSNFKQGDV